MTTHTIPAAWLRETYTGDLAAETKVHENDKGEFFAPVNFFWANPASGANTKFGLVAKPASGAEPFMFAMASVISAHRLYSKDPEAVVFATGDVLDIEGVGEFTIEDGGFLSHGVKLVTA